MNFLSLFSCSYGLQYCLRNIFTVNPSRPSTCFGSALISSKVPPQCREDGGDGAGVMLGIDEAGRGPVLGPMTYGAAYWSCVDDKEVSAMGFDDSKALTAEQRNRLFDRIDQVGATMAPCLLEL